MRVRLEDDPYKNKSIRNDSAIFRQADTDSERRQRQPGDDEHPIKNSQYGIMHSIRNRA